jgi:Synergist-CTERM protein sorting domain-containing protein
MRRALLAAVLLMPSLAAAQVTITETGDKPDGIVNIAECQGASLATSRIGIQWTLSTAVTSVDLRISDTSGCPLNNADNPTAHTSTIGTFPASTTTTSLAATDAMLRIGIDSAACEAGANLTVQVCAIPTNVAGGVAGTTISGTFLLDRAKPPTPAFAPSVAPGDGALRVSWDAVSGSRLTYRVEARPSDDPAAVPRRSEEVTGTSVRIDDLEIGRQYDVVLIAISEGGNESAASPIAVGIPVEVNDFWGLYQNAGGGEEGGCSTTGGGALALLAFAPLALRRRRS